MKLNGLFMSAAILAPAALAPLGVFADEAPAESNSKVMAEVGSGGMTLAAKDVNFGALTIGTEPGERTVADLLTATDHSGGNGFDVSVRADNYADTESTMLTTVQMNDGVIAPLTSEAATVLSGESKLAVQTYSGKISGKWGETPKAGVFSQDLVWTMSAKASPEAGEGGESTPLTLAAMNYLTKANLTGTFNVQGYATESGDVVNDAVVMPGGEGGPITQIKEVSSGHYEATKDLTVTFTGDRANVEKEAKFLKVKGFQLNLNQAEGTDSPKDIFTEITGLDYLNAADLLVEDSSININATDVLVPLDNGLDSVKVPLTLHLSDGKIATLTITFNISH